MKENYNQMSLFEQNINIYNIAIGVLQDKNIYNVSSFTGPKKECINFINEQIIKKSIDTFLKQELVLNFNYDSNTSIVLEDWYTLDELIEIGAIIL